jgi:replication factor C subunit 3/5
MVRSDVGIYDRTVVTEIIKSIAQTQQVDLNAKKRFKSACQFSYVWWRPHGRAVVVINEADQLSRDAQSALRRTMESACFEIRSITTWPDHH